MILYERLPVFSNDNIFFQSKYAIARILYNQNKISPMINLFEMILIIYTKINKNMLLYCKKNIKNY